MTPLIETLVRLVIEAAMPVMIDAIKGRVPVDEVRDRAMRAAEVRIQQRFDAAREKELFG